MTETDAARILTDLAARYSIAPYDPTQDITVHDVMQQLGVSAASARRMLAEEVAAGRLVMRHVSINGPTTNVYRKPA